MPKDQCKPLGELCMMSPECCHGEECVPDADGQHRCAPMGGASLADGLACFVGGQCRGSRCIPNTDGTRSCHGADVCARLGAPCAATYDCCGGTCVGTPGALVCASVDMSVGGPVCAAAGNPCQPADSTCCAGTVCSATSGGATICANATN